MAKDPFKKSPAKGILKGIFSTAVDWLKSFHPDSYPAFAIRRIPTILGYITKLIIIGLLIALIIGAFKAPGLKDKLDRDMDKFMTFKVSVDVNQTASIRLGDVVINTQTNRTELRDEKVLITKDKLIHKPVRCLLGFCLFSKEQSIMLGKYKDVRENFPVFMKAIQALFLILLPVLAIALFVWAFFMVLIWALLLTLAGLIFSLASKRNIAPNVLFKIALYSTSLMSIVIVVNIVLRFPLFYIPQIVSAIYFLIALMLLTEKKVAFEND